MTLSPVGVQSPGPNDPPQPGVPDRRPEGQRIPRACHGCGQYDTHPRHHHVVDPQNPAFDQLYHFDCCRDRGCPMAGDPHLSEHACGEVLKASGDKRGDELVSWLTGKEGKAHTERVNRRADAKRIAEHARAAIELHERTAEHSTQAAEQSRKLLQEAEATLK